jgi:hypothetical protein
MPTRPLPWMHHVWASLALVTWLLVSSCGYTTRPPYPSHIHTVYVPIFQSDDYRRGLEFQLTEAVVREIERSTPFKVVSSPEEADSILEGRIKFVEKDVRVENPDNEPRQIQLAMRVEVTWKDRRTGEVLRRGRTSSSAVPVTRAVQYAPELGQSFATAAQDVVDQLAKQIVNMMEEPW